MATWCSSPTWQFTKQVQSCPVSKLTLFGVEHPYKQMCVLSQLQPSLAVGYNYIVTSITGTLYSLCSLLEGNIDEVTLYTVQYVLLCMYIDLHVHQTVLEYYYNWDLVNNERGSISGLISDQQQWYSIQNWASNKKKKWWMSPLCALHCSCDQVQGCSIS